jgi:molybdenum cofactor cytidylyltransferase
MIAGVFLAAGRSERFGSDKLLHEIHGRPLVYYSLRSCVESSLPLVSVVIETGNHQLRSVIEQSFPNSEKLNFLENDSPQSGMMSSLKLGIRASGDCDGVMVCLADMPRITSGIINKLLEEFVEDNIVVPVCGGFIHHPRIIPKSVFPDFLGLRDDDKGTKVLADYPDVIIRVPVGEMFNYSDVDTASDLDAIDPPPPSGQNSAR